MYTLCWSPKGGSGTTVTACAIALIAARAGATVLVDLGGDVAPALGVATPGTPGVSEWLASPHAAGHRLLTLATPVGPRLALVHPGRAPTPAASDLHDERLAAACAEAVEHIVIDAGTGVPSSTLHRCAAASLMVVRPCYLGIRRASVHAEFASGVIVIVEPGRALSASDVERALGRPVLAEIPWDPAVARCIDAGLLGSRLPASMSRSLGRAERIAGAA